MQQHCPQCNALVDAETRVCNSCGATILQGSSAPELTAPASDTPNGLGLPASPAPLQPQEMVQQPYAPPAQQPYAPPAQQPYAPPAQQPYAQPAQQPYAQPYAQAPIQQVNVVMSNTVAPTVVMVRQKSVGVSLLLTFLFGPLGMFYSTVLGAVIMLIVSVVLAIFTLGISIFITWPICMIWGAMAVNSSNRAVMISK